MMHNQNKISILTNDKGAALIYLISIILIMSVLGSAMVNLMSTSTLGQVSANHMDRAYYIAEAGAGYALPLVKDDINSDLTYDDTYNIHNQTFILDDGGTSEEGSFTIEVDNTDPDYALLMSTGRINVGVSTDVETKLIYRMEKEPLGKILFTSPLFSNTTMTIQSNSYVEGDVGTNGPVITKEAGVTITGDEETSVGRTLDPIPFACVSCTKNKTFKNNKTWSNKTFEYSNLEFINGPTITIVGDVVIYVKKTLTMEDDTSFILREGASLTIYVDQIVDIMDSFSVTYEADPDPVQDFVIFGTQNATAINFGNNTSFKGTIYAPSSVITLGNGSNITGALIGDKITIGPNANIIWNSDVSYVSAPIGGLGSRVILDTLSDPVQYFSQ